LGAVQLNRFDEAAMKKVVLPLAALALTAGSAFAADLPSRKGPAVLPPPPPPPPLWTGFHVGLNAGAGWGNSNGQYLAVAPTAIDAGWPAGNAALASTQAAAFASAASASVSGGGKVGFIGGGQVGYDWQFYGSFLAGLEADIQGIASSGGARSIITAVPAGDGSNFVGVTSGRSNIQYLGTVRGRLGWLFLPTLLAYGTGGLAYAGVNLHTATSVTNDAVTAAGFGGVNFSNTQVGWTAGGGVEWMFAPNLVGQGRISLLRPRHGHPELWAGRREHGGQPQRHLRRSGPRTRQWQHRSRRRELSLQLGRGPRRRQVLTSRQLGEPGREAGLPFFEAQLPDGSRPGRPEEAKAPVYQVHRIVRIAIVEWRAMSYLELDN
jgi:outer membrane immunogenic protein